MKPSLTGTLRRLGYEWVEVPPERLADLLKQAGATLYQLRVYASNNGVYNTIHIDIPVWPGANTMSEVEIGPLPEP